MNLAFSRKEKNNNNHIGVTSATPISLLSNLLTLLQAIWTVEVHSQRRQSLGDELCACTKVGLFT